MLASAWRCLCPCLDWSGTQGKVRDTDEDAEGAHAPPHEGQPLIAPKPSAGPLIDRAFVVAVHHEYGYMILYAEKKRKGRFGGLPGGRLDSFEEDPQVAARRELFEETGLDIALDRFEKTGVVDRGAVFYVLRLTNDDSVPNGKHRPIGPVDSPFVLDLSLEHFGWAFLKDPDVAANAVKAHSGGRSANGLARIAELFKSEVR